MRNLAFLCLFLLGLTAFTADRAAGPDPRQQTVLWFATSGEVAACFLQGFAAAEGQLLAKGRSNGKQVIVTDLDETAISNAAPGALDILEQKTYSDERWDAWEKRGTAVAVPGSVEFFKLADALGYRICYLSNRSQKNAAVTMKNLRTLGFPQVDSAHIAFKTTTSSKEARRQALKAQGYEIVMLLGDNLSDFVELPSNTPEARRADSVKAHRADWGRRFIVFPNPMYGNWLDAVAPRGSDEAALFNKRLQELAKDAGYTSK